MASLSPALPCRGASDRSEVCMHSDDAFAPVAYLRLSQLHLEDKPGVRVGTSGGANVANRFLGWEGVDIPLTLYETLMCVLPY